MIASLSLRPATSRRPQARRNVSWERRRTAALRATRRGAQSRRRAFRPGAGARLFVLSAGMLAAAFLVALVYLRFATAISASGYDLHALETRRDELRRGNQLLALELQRLDAPARIESQAQRLGLVKAARTIFLTAGPSVTLR